jgi:hypothetical protein
VAHLVDQVTQKRKYCGSLGDWRFCRSCSGSLGRSGDSNKENIVAHREIDSLAGAVVAHEVDQVTQKENVVAHRKNGSSAAAAVAQ